MNGKGDANLPENEDAGGALDEIFSAQNMSMHENIVKALEETQALFQLLFESAPDANVLVSEEGRILAVNAQAEQIFGYGRSELVGASIETLLPVRFHESHLIYRNNFIKLPHMRTMDAGLELFARRKNGEEFPVDVVLSPLQTENGLLVLSVIRDITARKHMQAELDEVQHKLLHKAEQERSRLARELHDGPIQELYALAFQLGELNEKYDDADGMVDLAKKKLQETIASLRAIMSTLRPPTLAPFGLESTMRSHAQEFKKLYARPALHLELERDGQRLSEEVRLALFRIYQEALNNAVRHANANNIYVYFKMNVDSVELDIRDDGAGFEIPKHWVQLAREGHYGLVGIRERVDAVGGHFQLETSPDKGTHFHIRVPLNYLTAS